jgi:hypothetical protein
MNDLFHTEFKPLEVPVSDNGTEVLWAETVKGATRVVSVPVFAYGISRGAIISAKPEANRLRIVTVVRPSQGATIRAYVNSSIRASDLYLNYIFPVARDSNVRVGPATFFDPEIVAFHLANRSDVGRVTPYLDDLARKEILRFWELGDPQAANDEKPDESAGEQWELVHQLPIEGQPGRATMS